MGGCLAASLDELVLKRARMKDPAKAVLANLKNYEAALEQGDDCRAPLLPPPSFKGKRPLGWFDCAMAPCRDACAAGQDVSRYMYWVGRGDADRAKSVIWETNPLPAVSGMVCDQKCRSRCTRGLFDRPLAIRAVKRFAVENGSIPAADPASLGDATRVAVVGAGPAGPGRGPRAGPGRLLGRGAWRPTARPAGWPPRSSPAFASATPPWTTTSRA